MKSAEKHHLTEEDIAAEGVNFVLLTNLNTDDIALYHCTTLYIAFLFFFVLFFVYGSFFLHTRDLDNFVLNVMQHIL